MPRLHSLLRLLLILVAFMPGLAQASVTKGAIKGQAIDEGGLPIPGVLVTITSENMMGPRQSDSDADGRFYFQELAPGIYELTAEKAGFATYKRTNLTVNIGRTIPVTIEMALATAAEEIVVESSRAVIDTESANRGSVLTKEFLERIPAGRSYQSAVQMTAGVTGGSNPNVGGSSSNENTYMLDGVNITDPVTGTFSLNFNFDSIEQIEVLTSAFDPEYGVNLGGAINVVTETGGNTLEFQTGVRYTNGNWSPRLDSRYAADGTELIPTDFDSQYDTYSVSVKVSGPIVRDKAWFIISYQMSRSLVANVGIDLPRDFDGHYLFGKLTVQPSSSHRFTVLGQTDPSTIDNVDQSDRFVQPEAQPRQAQGGYVTSLQWDWYISPETFLETKALVQKSYIESYGVPCTHNQDLGYHPCQEDELENTIDFVTPGRFGVNNAFDSGNVVSYQFDDRWRGTLTTKFSLLRLELLGSHDLKAGLEGDLYVWNRTIGIPGNVYYYDINLLAYDPDTLNNYYRVETTGPFNYVSDAERVGAFLQDVYKPIDNLTFRYGFRYDRQVFRNDVGEAVTDTGLWGPRFAVIWDPWANSKTKIVGAVGRFNDTSRLGVADYLRQSGFGSKLVLGEYFVPASETWGSELGASYSYFPLENTNTVLDNTTAPRADAFNVGAEREIFPDTAVLLYFNGKFTRNLYAFDELNLFWDSDGYNTIGNANGSTDTYYRLRTPNIARRDYYRTDLGVNRVWADRWELQATYSYTVSKGSVQGSPSSFLQVPGQVEHYINGLLGTDIRHDIAAGMAWDIPNDPWTTQLGAIVQMESGYPTTRSYDNGSLYGAGSLLKDTIGTYARSVTWWRMSLLVQQTIPVRKGDLQGVVEFTNITNNRYGWSAWHSYDNRWITYDRMNPIQVTVGAEYQF